MDHTSESRDFDFCVCGTRCTCLERFTHESPPPPLHHTSLSHLPPALLTAGHDCGEVRPSWQTCWCCSVFFLFFSFFHSPCGETTNSFIFLPYSSLFLAPFLSPHATVRQRTNTLVFLIKRGVPQREKAVMDDGRKIQREMGRPSFVDAEVHASL